MEQRHANNAKWLKANAEHRRLQHAAYQIANKERIRLRRAAYRKRNRAKERERFQLWHKKNPDKQRAYGATRRARERGAQLGDRKPYLALVKVCRTAPVIPCYWCGGSTNPKERNLDHIIPLSKGGEDAVGNLCIACSTCNQRKHDKMPEDFSGQAELRLA